MSSQTTEIVTRRVAETTTARSGDEFAPQWSARDPARPSPRQPPTPEEELRSLGLTFNSCPTLRSSRLPFALALRDGPGGCFLALAAFEVERFQVAPRDRSSTRDILDRAEEAWRAIAHALALFDEEREVWHVVATRAEPGPDGALIRVGWVVVGRGATTMEAALQAESAFNDIWTLQQTSLDYLSLDAVSTAEAMADLVRCSGAPFLNALRRTAWQRPVGLVRDVDRRAQSSNPGVLLPWQPRGNHWTPLVEALASSATPAAMMIRVRTAVTPSKATMEHAEDSALAVAEEHARLLDQPVRGSATMSTYDLLAAGATRRVSTLRGPCLAADVALATWEPPTPGLLSLAAASLTSNSDNGSEQSLPQPPLCRVALDRKALWRPLDASSTPELLVGAHEAWTLVRTVEPPADEVSPLPCSRSRSLPLRSAPTSGACLGEAEHRGASREVRLPDEARFLHTYVVGQTGTGKSTLLLNMLVDDLESGRGVTVLDPHGSLIDEVLARVPAERRADVIIVDPTNGLRYVPLNPLIVTGKGAADYLSLRDRIIDELFDTAAALYDLSLVGGPMFELYFRSFLGLLMGAQQPTDRVPIIPMLEALMGSADLQKELMSQIADEDPITHGSLIRARAAKGESSLANMVPYITSKLNRFYIHTAARRTLCQPECLDFNDVIENRKILLVALSPIHLGREAAALIARQIVLRLSVAAMERGVSPRATPHYIFVDEFQNVATERFAALLAEARKFRLGIVLAHQYTSQLVHKNDTRVLDSILGNVGTVVSFRVGANDADLLQRVMAPRIASDDLSGLSNFRAFVRSVGPLGNVPFLLRTGLPRPPTNFLVDETRKASLSRYGTPVAQVDREIQRVMASFG